MNVNIYLFPFDMTTGIGIQISLYTGLVVPFFYFHIYCSDVFFLFVVSEAILVYSCLAEMSNSQMAFESLCPILLCYKFKQLF